jgi:acyl-CoA synthetase (NDP forming)
MCIRYSPVDYSFSQDAWILKSTIEIGVDRHDVGSFIVILQAEILDSYVDTLKSIDYKGKPIIACVAGKEFEMPGVIKMEKAGIPVFSTPEQVADALGIMYRHYKRVKQSKN